MITKKTDSNLQFDFEKGESILFDKPINWSSFKAIHHIRKIIGVKKVGHAGTLDPKATGLLIVCTGKKTKEITKYQDLPKVYTGTFTLGKTTTTMDSEGEIITEQDCSFLNDDLIIEASKKFLGETDQIPPMYSAINYGGKKLYELARKGKTVVREPRKINISTFEIVKIELPEVHFKIQCSKGTYIRVIADDFGKLLRCGAYLSSLRRTMIGDYSVEDAFEPREFKDFLTNHLQRE